MAIDAELLEKVQTQNSPMLHLYDWNEPSATYGYFIDPLKFLIPKASHSIRLARRPTGGGIIFHLTDLAFSMVIPSCHHGYSLNTLENYAFVNQILIKAIKTFLKNETTPELLPLESIPLDLPSRHFCMAKPTKFDVMLQGRKVGGGAQRKTKHGFLHQGTISIAMPSESFLKQILLPGTCVYESMLKNSYSLLPLVHTQNQLAEARQQMRTNLINSLT